MRITSLRIMKYLLAVLLTASFAFAMVPLNSQEPVQDPVRQAPEKLTEEDECLDCHESLLKARLIHEPVEEEMCEACHDQADETLHKFTHPKNLNDTCLTCHDEPAGEHLHEPIVEGDCAACHDMHKSEHDGLMLSDNESELCMKCHQQEVHLEREFIHGPVDAGMCTICHQPHAADQEALLLDEKLDLCLSCHEDLSEDLDDAENIHLPVEEDCSLCHETHASDHPFQLLQSSPTLCFECHDEVRQKTELSVDHAAVHTEEGCLNCHTAHHSPYEGMLNNKPYDVCLSCHDKPVTMEEELELPDMDSLLRMEFKHGPIQEGNCSACHDPHGSEVFSILREPYPKRFYSKWQPTNYSLCFRCHEESAFTDARTDSLTEFRNGDQNLHFLHVNRDRKGRTCRACHETHASAYPHHLAETVPFGGWDLPLKYQLLQDGGSCAPGCHSPTEYNRVQPVSYEVVEAVAEVPVAGGTEGTEETEESE